MALHEVSGERLDAPRLLPRRAGLPHGFQVLELTGEALESLDGELVDATRRSELPGQTFVFESGKPQGLQDQAARIDEAAFCGSGGSEFCVENGEPLWEDKLSAGSGPGQD